MNLPGPTIVPYLLNDYLDPRLLTLPIERYTYLTLSRRPPIDARALINKGNISTSYILVAPLEAMDLA